MIYMNITSLKLNNFLGERCLPLAQAVFPNAPISYIGCFSVTSRRPCWCPYTKERRPCWCSQLVLSELNSIVVQPFSFGWKTCSSITWVKAFYSTLFEMNNIWLENNPLTISHLPLLYNGFSCNYVCQGLCNYSQPIRNEPPEQHVHLTTMPLPYKTKCAHGG